MFIVGVVRGDRTLLTTRHRCLRLPWIHGAPWFCSCVLRKGISSNAPYKHKLREPTPLRSQRLGPPCRAKCLSSLVESSLKPDGYFGLGLISWTVLRSNSWRAERVSQTRERWSQNLGVGLLNKYRNSFLRPLGDCGGGSGVGATSVDVTRFLFVVWRTRASCKGIIMSGTILEQTM